MTSFIEKHRPYAIATVLALLLVWAGCETDDEPIQDPPFFEIEVDGDVNEALSGQNAIFAPISDPETGEQGLLFQFATDEAVQRGVALPGKLDEIPAEGTYDIIEFDPEVDDTFGALGENELYGEYITADPEDPQQHIAYISGTGVLEITHSSEDRVEGNFEFTAALLQEAANGDGAAEVQVTGSFTAQRTQLQ